MNDKRKQLEARRRQLVDFMAQLGVNAAQYAAIRGVPRSVVCKFLGGKDVWLSTWDKLDPATYADTHGASLAPSTDNARPVS